MIAKAINNLRPNTEWSMDKDDVENIVWHTPDVAPLTRDEVEKEIKNLMAKAEKERQAQTKARNDAIAHAKSLGFTDAMIAVMYPNLLEE